MPPTRSRPQEQIQSRGRDQPRRAADHEAVEVWQLSLALGSRSRRDPVGDDGDLLRCYAGSDQLLGAGSGGGDQVTAAQAGQEHLRWADTQAVCGVHHGTDAGLSSRQDAMGRGGVGVRVNDVGLESAAEVGQGEHGFPAQNEVVALAGCPNFGHDWLHAAFFEDLGCGAFARAHDIYADAPSPERGGQVQHMLLHVPQLGIAGYLEDVQRVRLLSGAP